MTQILISKYILFQTATMLALYLESFTTFFPYLASQLPSTMSSEQVKLFASAFILRSLGQLVCNGHAALSLATFDDSGKGKYHGT